jgi:hypothetical protein
LIKKITSHAGEIFSMVIREELHVAKRNHNKREDATI